MPEATEELIRALGARGADEVEMVEQLGFPDGFTDTTTDVQVLYFKGEGDCQLILSGSRVRGHPHDPLPFMEWDGVVRPTSIRAFRRHVQRLSPRIRPGSPLGEALLAIERGTDTPGGAPWLRAVHWWAFCQASPRDDLAERLKRWLTMLGDDDVLRIAAELVRPGFAREVLVASHHWPPSGHAISMAAVDAAILPGWPDGHHVVCLSMDDPGGADDLGEMRFMRSRQGLEHEIATFAEPDRATSWWLGEGKAGERYDLTGDGEIWRRARDAWVLCGDAGTLLIATLEPVEERIRGLLHILEGEHPALPLDAVRALIRGRDFRGADEELLFVLEELVENGGALTDKSREALTRYARETGLIWNLTLRDLLRLPRD